MFMKKFKILLGAGSLLLVLFTSVCLGGESGYRYEEEAEVIYELGYVKGTGNGLELGRAVTRTEALILLLRLLGLEEDALAFEGDHPFDDVPEWAKAYVAYAYENGYTNGVSATKFGAGDPVSSKQFVTFMLRGLGHDDRLGHFSYENALVYGGDIGLLEEEEVNRLRNGLEGFLRDDCMGVFYRALQSPRRGQVLSISETLLAGGDSDLDLEKVALISEMNKKKYAEKTEDGWLIPTFNPLKEGFFIDERNLLIAYPEAKYFSVLTYENNDEADDLNHSELDLRLMFLPYINHGYREIEGKDRVMIQTATWGLFSSGEEPSFTGDNRCLMIFDEDKDLMGYAMIEEGSQGENLVLVDGGDFDVATLYEKGKVLIDELSKQAVESTRADIENYMKSSSKNSKPIRSESVIYDSSTGSYVIKYSYDYVEKKWLKRTNVFFLMDDFDYGNGVIPDEELHAKNLVYAIFKSELTDLNPERGMDYLSIGLFDYGDDEFMEQYVYISSSYVGANLVSMHYLVTYDGRILYTYEPYSGVLPDLGE